MFVQVTVSPAEIVIEAGENWYWSVDSPSRIETEADPFAAAFGEAATVEDAATLGDPPSAWVPDAVPLEPASSPVAGTTCVVEVCPADGAVVPSLEAGSIDVVAAGSCAPTRVAGRASEAAKTAALRTRVRALTLERLDQGARGAKYPAYGQRGRWVQPGAAARRLRWVRISLRMRSRRGSREEST